MIINNQIDYKWSTPGLQSFIKQICPNYWPIKRKDNGSAGRNIYIQPLMPSGGGWRYNVGPTLAEHDLSDVVPTLANHRED